jgi:hypothetical protein
VSNAQISTERWRPIPCYEGFYEVSDRGLIRSVERFVRSGHGHQRRVSARILKQAQDRGYMLVALCRDGHQKTKRVHHAVLETFVGPRPDGMEGCHNDGDASNNRLVNLRWDTSSANTFDAIRHGTHLKTRRVWCNYGHELIESNIYRPPSQPTKRLCRQCRSDGARKRREVSAA